MCLRDKFTELLFRGTRQRILGSVCLTLYADREIRESRGKADRDMRELKDLNQKYIRTFAFLELLAEPKIMECVLVDANLKT